MGVASHETLELARSRTLDHAADSMQKWVDPAAHPVGRQDRRKLQDLANEMTKS